MAKSVLLSTRISPEMSSGLARLSKQTDRPKSQIVTAAISSYLEAEAEYVASIAKSRKSARAGRYRPHADVMASLRKKIAKPK